jgi:protein-disulfide isomerase
LAEDTRGMNRFYLLLAGVAVVAGVLIWLGSRPRAATALEGANPTVTITAADSAFRGHVLGSDSAPVEVVEFADFQCPHCAEFAIVQFPTIREQLINTGRVRWRFMEYPLGFQWSQISAVAAECAADQGKFWEMEAALFQRQSDWGRGRKNPMGVFRDLAQGIGLDVATFNRCVSDEHPAGRIEWSHQLGVAQNVTGTPAFFVRGVKVEIATSDGFKALVDSLTAGRP